MKSIVALVDLSRAKIANNQKKHDSFRISQQWWMNSIEKVNKQVSYAKIIKR